VMLGLEVDDAAAAPVLIATEARALDSP